MRFIVDAQLPPALAGWLVANGMKPSMLPTSIWPTRPTGQFGILLFKPPQ
jgi:predicted nuclease of predicted toxin-antitoxin system